ncbi:hypothetical protein BTO05_04665 [Winogradskyella sp. PC-19]|uniref:polysaccharide pyruvyl transferase family protein n=1 Tax=unclassified Winogradskyella TaxID=2615021 RepID=UPI000B3BF698|nr:MULTISPECIES: polysaccharide pyruvyl transferase family protein [unclassified Winogradskyella]ARV08960.1 hypothetical protein BTO05_04665 [Winogradskyella sp. PC-19]
MGHLNLYWWSKSKLSLDEPENFGDLLSKYIVQKISGKEVKWFNPNKKRLITPKHYLAIGSIITVATEKSIVWGSGIISKTDEVKNATFLAVRGPQTRQYLLQKNYSVPEVYGDPAILLPKLYNPKLEKRYDVGIIPHYVDNKIFEKNEFLNKNIGLINFLTNNIENTVDKIVECDKIISSSLHGVIVAHSYGIPALWIKFSDNLYGDDIKFYDYFNSVGLDYPEPIIISKSKLNNTDINTFFEHYSDIALPKPEVVNELSSGLLNVCPFAI